MALDAAGSTLQSVGNYDLVEKIAEGGMGTVYKGRHRITGAIVAVKVVPKGEASPIIHHRFLAEITDLLVSEGSPDRVLEAVADALRQIVPHDTLTIYEADVPLRVLRPVLVRDTWADEILFGAGVAVDDENLVNWCISWHPTRALTAEERAAMHAGLSIHVMDYAPATPEMLIEPASNPSSFSSFTRTLVSFSISVRNGPWPGSRSVIATPAAPMRAVRPTRCT